MVQMIARKGGLYACLTAALISTNLLLFPERQTHAAEPAKESGAGFAAADHAFMSLHYERADSLYNAIRQSHPADADVYWKLARLNVTMAEAISPKEAAQRMPFYNKAVEYARKAVALDNANGAAHTWLAASLAVKADRLGNKEKLARANEIKQELDRALALNPHDDVAWSILGSYYRQTANIGWMTRLLGNTFVGKMPQGSAQASEHAFKKAISLNPRAIRHYHELALLYIDEHRKKEALQLLQVALKKPVLMKSDVRRLEDIRVLVRKLSKEVDEPVEP